MTILFFLNQDYEDFNCVKFADIVVIKSQGENTVEITFLTVDDEDEDEEIQTVNVEDLRLVTAFTMANIIDNILIDVDEIEYEFIPKLRQQLRVYQEAMKKLQWNLPELLNSNQQAMRALARRMGEDEENFYKFMFE